MRTPARRGALLALATCLSAAVSALPTIPMPSVGRAHASPPPPTDAGPVPSADAGAFPLADSAPTPAPDLAPDVAPTPAPDLTPAPAPDLTPAPTPDLAPAPALTPTPTGPQYGAVATATRTPRPLRDIPQVVTVIGRREIDQNPTLTTDSLVRALPSALTFRRSTSLVSEPSAQGLNLRGLGPSGVSRTLVLIDGVPANDPFGGSIYWRALPRLGIERVEVVPSGGSALYGSAIAGVVQLFSRSLANAFDLDASYGSFHTWLLAARAAAGGREAGLALETEWLRSDGYRVIAREQAGPVDRAADSEHLTLNARAETRPFARTHVVTSLRLFREEQNGGTRYTNAAVRFGLLALEANRKLDHRASLALRLFGRLQQFEQERARVSAERDSEALAARQRVPADDEGVSLVYQSGPRSWHGRHTLAGGLDARRIGGVSKEQLWPATIADTSVRSRKSGGEQLLAGAFLEELYTPNDLLELDLALRADLVRNRDGSSELVQDNGAQAQTSFAAHTNYALSPRLGALVRPLSWLALRASGYRAFRAPTLNELYRPFQVGTVLTAANPYLSPELVHGFEAGLELTPIAGLVTRATGFWNRLERPITNVTLPEPLPDGTTRMRQNLGSALVRGLEAALELRVLRELTAILAYTLAASDVQDAGALRELRGKALPQAPRQRASALLLFDDPELFSAALQVRVSGPQYEDDLNTLKLRQYALIDLSLSRGITNDLSVFAAFENLLNTTYLVGRSGIDTVGQPFAFRIGVRLRVPTSEKSATATTAMRAPLTSRL